ncbi:MAG TPA: methyl-accepting chemotaxis protein [Polyangiaceae bacterium]|nr:methyl-accepting chemotaxis protein [Polyangiaceae bacterium]
MSDPESNSSSVSAIQRARLLAALEATKTAASHASGEQRAANSGLTRQRSDLEAVQRSARNLASRNRDIRNSLQVLRESVDRAKLSALNAGLEGARLGEPVGKALVVMSDEQRNLLARALDTLDEHGALLADVERDRERFSAELSQLSEGATQTFAALARAEQQSQLTSALLDQLGVDCAELFGGDPEAARAMTEAAAHVRTAAASLLELTQRAPLGANALRELLSPLLCLLPTGEEKPR